MLTLAQNKLITLTIDGNQVSVPQGTTVYQASKQLGIDIPIFCYLDRLPPFGACRMCLVEVEKMGKLQASCTLLATDGMVVTTQSQKAIQGRNEIIELLLINHPLDCPICDRGGECPLQENALAHGPGVSRFFEEKRHFKKPLPLGPVLMLDRERCIICARCTRFCDELSGDHALEFIERGYRTEVGTPKGEPIESKFIGNTIMICPVGALTSQVYRFRARPWDNHPTKTTCSLCPVGCSMIIDSRDGEIMRTRSCENKDVNDLWLCDKGWFGYEYTSSQDRLKKTLIKENGVFREAEYEEAIGLVAKKMLEVKGKTRIAAFGGNTLTTEENYLFQQLIRQNGGVNNIDHRIGTPIFSLADEGLSPGMECSIGSLEELNFAILLGIDLTEEFPVLWLRLRQAINRHAKTLFAGHFAPEIAPYFTETILHAPGEEIDVLKNQVKTLANFEGKGAIFVGRQYLQNKNRKAILSQILKLNSEFKDVSLNILEGNCNSMGARYAGVHPELLPRGEKLKNPGLDALSVLKEAAKNGWDFLYVAGCNPAAKFKSSLWESARKNLKFLVVQDLFLTETAKEADVVLPTLSYVEKGGSFINIENRVQKLFPGKEVPETLFSDARIFAEIARAANQPLATDAAFLESLKPGTLPLNRQGINASSESISEQNNHQLKTTFSKKLFDHGVRMKHDPHVFQLVKEAFVSLHPDEAKSRGLKEGDPIRVTHLENSMNAKVALNKKMALNTALFPLNFPEVAARELADELWNGLAIEIKKI
ncbi:NADH-quinone oxidoreductase subunit NuoG [Criblamydia sequanensis]|uniref:NADH-quinone oxidoreductase n=1 Tax=Candidatus Criblamydia sequanensis CRIB-18 TaxID=1437425 RepID=A0A090D1B4_9BACT|nr:NADH-quinone oxidoreductase subunit NuoG [Criblamydia sequanensis]CDR33438.1 NADH-quinone oxidoreductase subunit G [Criblamydia sequanensis CRIB-18]